MRLLKAFTAYYKQLKIDKEIEALKAESLAKLVAYKAETQAKLATMPQCYDDLYFNTPPSLVQKPIDLSGVKEAGQKAAKEIAKNHPNGKPKSKPYKEARFL